MNKNKRNLIMFLVILVLVLSLFIYIFLSKKNKDVSKLESNTINEKVINNTILDTNTTSNELQVAQVENIVQEESNEEKQDTVENNTEVKEKVVKNNQDENTKIQSETKKTEENKSTYTKESASQSAPTASNSNNETKPTAPPVQEPVQEEPKDTISRITESELSAEKSKYLSDIQSVKPGLKYVYSKRGQVFWPYRKREISIAVGEVSFGTIYYYVETFVEGNEEKFKYYIDWDGN